MVLLCISFTVLLDGGGSSLQRIRARQSWFGRKALLTLQSIDEFKTIVDVISADNIESLKVGLGMLYLKSALWKESL